MATFKYIVSPYCKDDGSRNYNRQNEMYTFRFKTKCTKKLTHL
jgi:hypothetical protein